ncbi:hypothetical protein VTK73DRAFT_6408 [Phialemonium thermophilum]|uniref:Transmembrane protein n=1 Tax=Phialemonium thermophilum TaxID=223376 RepID=A0ABR3WJL5_9PEZI
MGLRYVSSAAHCLLDDRFAVDQTALGHTSVPRKHTPFPELDWERFPHLRQKTSRRPGTLRMSPSSKSQRSTGPAVAVFVLLGLIPLAFAAVAAVLRIRRRRRRPELDANVVESRFAPYWFSWRTGNPVASFAATSERILSANASASASTTTVTSTATSRAAGAPDPVALPSAPIPAVLRGKTLEERFPNPLARRLAAKFEPRENRDRQQKHAGSGRGGGATLENAPRSVAPRHGYARMNVPMPQDTHGRQLRQSPGADNRLGWDEDRGLPIGGRGVGGLELRELETLEDEAVARLQPAHGKTPPSGQRLEASVHEEESRTRSSRKKGSRTRKLWRRLWKWSFGT